MIRATQVGRVPRPDCVLAALLVLALAMSGCSLASGGSTAIRARRALQPPPAAVTRSLPPTPGTTNGGPTSVAITPGAAAATPVAQAGPTVQPPTPSPPSSSPPASQPAIVGVTFHRQQDPDWCDPADLQMWMESLGVAIPGSNDHEKQQAIWDYELSHNDTYSLAEWNASPHAVATAFEHFSGRAAGDPAPSSADDGGVILSRSLALNHQPAVVMVDHGTHYILVTGVTLGPDGASAPPLEVTVVDSLAQGDNPIDPASGGTSTYSWETFKADLFTVVQQRPGPWEDHWIVIAAGEPAVQ